MYLPTFPRRMAAVRHVQTDFRGYDHRPSCPEGGIYEMTNGSAADSPRGRTVLDTPRPHVHLPVQRHAERPVRSRRRAALVRRHDSVL